MYRSSHNQGQPTGETNMADSLLSCQLSAQHCLATSTSRLIFWLAAHPGYKCN